MISTVDVLSGRYHDSVRLLQVTREALGVPGVEDALVAMATDLNLGLLEGMGFARPAEAAGPDDLIVAVRAIDAGAVADAVAAVQRALAGPSPTSDGGLFTPPPLHVAAAAGRAAGAGLALISVPGPHAFVEAMDALRAGMHVMVFSDNVPIAQEVALKEEAAVRDLLVMGPDCGTAIIAGVGLGFANVVEPGPVGLTGASGTGLQQMCCLLDAAGVGVRHALGTGSRDLSAEVGGRSTLRALAALDADPGVEAIVVVSKPPDPAVAGRVAEAVAACTTPVISALLGSTGVTLEGAARATIAQVGLDPPEPPSWLPQRTTTTRPGVLRGLFSGGTLRDEARTIAADALGPVAVEPTATGHRMVDYGDDQFTRGRAHPMIDASLRLEAFAAAVADRATAVVLLDVVLGHAAHPDPALELVPEVERATSMGIPVVVSLCGSRLDPQGRNRQAQALTGAGAEVYLSNAAAARRATALVAGSEP